MHIRLFLISLFISTVLYTNLLSQEQPSWVKQNTIDDARNYYFGIGISDSSFADADLKARIQFAMNVEIKVKSIFEQEIKETNDQYSNHTKVTNQLISDVSLKGITVSARYSDSLYYSLIQYKKDDYDSLIASEIRRELERQKAKNLIEEERRSEEIRTQKVKDSLALIQQHENLKKQKEQLALEAKQKEYEEQEREFRKKQYGEFLSQLPPEKVVTLRNGELTHGTTSFALKMSVKPFTARRAYAAFRLWQFEISSDVVLNESKIWQGELFGKIQILPGIGEYYKTTLAIGISQAAGKLNGSAIPKGKWKYSFFLSGNVTLPHFAYSHISFYGDKRKFAVGINSYPFYSLFKNHIGFVLDLHYIPDADFRDIYGDPVMLQGGIRLAASEKMSTLFAYEGNERFFLTLELAF